MNNARFGFCFNDYFEYRRKPKVCAGIRFLYVWAGKKNRIPSQFFKIDK
ncbi:MAG: hypothetical protein MUE85_04550 [Microscillaceae bacterium]|nr:hypothetical protein [Microscillaceae bacterium]